MKTNKNSKATKQTKSSKTNASNSKANQTRERKIYEVRVKLTAERVALIKRDIEDLKKAKKLEKGNMNARFLDLAEKYQTTQRLVRNLHDRQTAGWAKIQPAKQIKKASKKSSKKQIKKAA